MQPAINEWRKIAQPIADAIREVNSDAIIVVPGHSRCASDMYDYLIRPFKALESDKNIIYDSHRYGGLEDPNATRYAEQGFVSLEKLIAFAIGAK